MARSLSALSVPALAVLAATAGPAAHAVFAPGTRTVLAEGLGFHPLGVACWDEDHLFLLDASLGCGECVTPKARARCRHKPAGLVHGHRRDGAWTFRRLDFDLPATSLWLAGAPGRSLAVGTTDALLQLFLVRQGDGWRVVRTETLLEWSRLRDLGPAGEGFESFTMPPDGSLVLGLGRAVVRLRPSRGRPGTPEWLLEPPGTQGAPASTQDLWTSQGMLVAHGAGRIYVVDTRSRAVFGVDPATRKKQLLLSADRWPEREFRPRMAFGQGRNLYVLGDASPLPGARSFLYALAPAAAGTAYEVVPPCLETLKGAPFALTPAGHLLVADYLKERIWHVENTRATGPKPGIADGAAEAKADAAYQELLAELATQAAVGKTELKARPDPAVATEVDIQARADRALARNVDARARAARAGTDAAPAVTATAAAEPPAGPPARQAPAIPARTTAGPAPIRAGEVPTGPDPARPLPPRASAGTIPAVPAPIGAGETPAVPARTGAGPGPKIPAQAGAAGVPADPPRAGAGSARQAVRSSGEDDAWIVVEQRKRPAASAEAKAWRLPASRVNQRGIAARTRTLAGAARFPQAFGAWAERTRRDGAGGGLGRLVALADPGRALEPPRTPPQGLDRFTLSEAALRRSVQWMLLEAGRANPADQVATWRARKPEGAPRFSFGLYEHARLPQAILEVADLQAFADRIDDQPGHGSLAGELAAMDGITGVQTTRDGLSWFTYGLTVVLDTGSGSRITVKPGGARAPVHTWSEPVSPDAEPAAVPDPAAAVPTPRAALPGEPEPGPGAAPAPLPRAPFRLNPLAKEFVPAEPGGQP